MARDKKIASNQDNLFDDSQPSTKIGTIDDGAAHFVKGGARSDDSKITSRTSSSRDSSDLFNDDNSGNLAAGAQKYS